MASSAFYRWYIDHSPVWEAKRRAAWERCIRYSAGRCELCLTRSACDVHHWRGGYEALGNERLDQLLVLCRPCHSASHFRSDFPTWPELVALYRAFDPVARGFGFQPENEDGPP